MQNKQSRKGLIYIVLTLIMLVVTVLSGFGNLPAFADTYANSNVLKDLQNDPTFKSNDYPINQTDYSINVIQIAEGAEGNLYLYTYQPCQNTRYLIATDVNMSLSETVDGTRLYNLILINTNGVFGKYLVKDVTVSSNSVRYYNITSVYRDWDETIDGKSENNNTLNKKAYQVGKVFKVTTENGNLKYTCEPTYTVNIINPYSDYLIYATSASLPSISSIKLNFERMGMIDAHYIAFSTDWEIDRLKSATVTYSFCAGTGHYNTFLGFDCGGDLSYGDEQVGYAYPTYEDKFERENTFWNAGLTYSYSWDRIQTVAEFLAGETNLTEETKTNLNGKQWVLRFLETERTQTETGILGYKKYTTNFTKVDKVSILRLEFETDGICYNLGTVSDMVSGDIYPGNAEKNEQTSFLDNFLKFLENVWNVVSNFTWQQWLIIVIGIIVGICVIVAIILAIIKFGIKAVRDLVLWIFTKLFQLVWWILCLPFRAIAALFKRSGENDDEEE